MKPLVRRALIAGVAAALTTAALGSAPAQADPLSPAPYTDCANVTDNLVVNCGFEANLDGWTIALGEPAGQIVANGTPHSGAHSAGATGGSVDNPVSLSQTIAGTAPGHVYTVGYWLAVEHFMAAADNHFAVTVSNVQGGSQTFDEQTNSGFSDWMYFQDTFVAGSGDPTLTFAFYNGANNAAGIDDVAVIDNAGGGATAQTITFTSPLPSHAVVGDTYTATATGGGSGNPVQFFADPRSTAVCTVDHLGHVTFISVGICRVDATQAGNGFYRDALVAQQSITVYKAPQTITFATAPTHAIAGNTYSVTATGGASANPVTFSSNSSSTVCTVDSDGTIHAIGAGRCVITARQAGNTNYKPGTAKLNIKIYAS